MVLTIIMLSGCLNIEELGELEIESAQPSLAFPLLQTSISTEDLIEELDTTLEVGINSDGAYAFLFYATPYVHHKSDLFPKVAIGLPIPIVDSVVAFPIPSLLDLEVEKTILKGDNLQFILNSDIPEDITVVVKSDQILKEGTPFFQQYQLEYKGLLPLVFQSPVINLRGYELNPQGGGVTIRFLASKEDGSRVQLPASFIRIDSLDFSYLEGTGVSTRVNTGLQIIEIETTDTLINGTYSFENPKIHFDLSNSFGGPVAAEVTNMYIETSDGTQEPILGSLLDDLFFFQFPSFDEIGQTKMQRITFDRSNSNILDFSDKNISKIFYEMDIIFNPLDIPDQSFFIMDSSEARLDATVELGFDARIEDVQLTHSVDVDLTRLDSILSFRLKMLVANSIPISFASELYFSKKGTNMRIEIPEENNTLIEPALVDPTGEVQSPSENILFYTGSQEVVDQLIQMDLLEVKLQLQSPQNGQIPSRIKPGQWMDIQIGMEVKLD